MAIAEVVVPVLIASVGSFFLGQLSRQPEINELKKQVKILQGEVTRLENLVSTQDRQIRKLMDEYNKLSYEQKKEKEERIKGSLIFQYAFKEYLEMLIDAERSGHVQFNKEERLFYNAFGKIIGLAEITPKNREIVMQYIKEKYGDKINRYQAPDLEYILGYELGKAG